MIKNIDDIEIVARDTRTNRIQIATIGDYRKECGSQNLLVKMMTGYAFVGLPIAFSMETGWMFIEKGLDWSGFIRGHETGHIKLGHYASGSGVLNNAAYEMAADRYAVIEGFCSKEEAIVSLQALKASIRGEGLKGFMRSLIFVKIFRELDKRILALKAL